MKKQMKKPANKARMFTLMVKRQNAVCKPSMSVLANSADEAKRKFRKLLDVKFSGLSRSFVKDDLNGEWY